MTQLISDNEFASALLNLWPFPHLLMWLCLYQNVSDMYMSIGGPVIDSESARQRGYI